MFAPDEGNCDAPKYAFLPSFPGILKSHSVDIGENVDPQGRPTEHEDQVISEEIRLTQVIHRCPELGQRAMGSQRTLRTALDPDVEVAGRARIRIAS
jgi:hypothetical protein